MLNPNSASINYQATTAFLNLVLNAATTRKSKRKDYHGKAAKIRYFLKAAALTPTYITSDQANQIYQCLIVTSGIQDFPVPPTLPTPSNPVNSLALKGDKGDTGPKGADGGGTDFIKANATFATTVDSFPIASAYAARWDYIVTGTAQRAGTIYATWSADGSIVQDTGDGLTTDDIGGSTDPIAFSVAYNAGNIQLNAAISSGTWTITGTRYFIPNQGAGVGTINNYLPLQNIYIGNSSNVATPQPVSGDIAISAGGVTSINAGVIVNADISNTAAIAVNKLAALTASKAVVTDASGALTTVATTPTELGYLSGATSNIQAQLNAVVTPTGAITTVTSSNLTSNRAVISNASGKIAVSSTTDVELSYSNGLTVTAGGLIYANGTGIRNSGAGTTGQIIVSNGAAAPSWLAQGTSGQLLSSQGPGVAPTWIGGNSYTAITLINGWLGTILYRVDHNGRVFFKGNISSFGPPSSQTVTNAGAVPNPSVGAGIYVTAPYVGGVATITITATGQIIVTNGYTTNQLYYFEGTTYQS